MRCLWLVLCACGRIGFDPAVSRFDASGSGDAPASLGPFGPWQTPVEEVVVNTTVREFGTTISDDGLELWWSSPRLPTVGSADIWYANRSDRGAPFATTYSRS